MEKPILEVVCEEYDHELKAVRKIVRSVYPLKFTPENLQKFWDKAKEFPYLYGFEILNNPQDFFDLFFYTGEDGSINSNGLFWVLDDFVGVFYLTDIDTRNKSASVHYTFFDKRSNGRVKLVKECIKYVFKKYPFQRLSTSVPLYAKPITRKFILDIGFYYEGKTRDSSWYKGQWFSTNLYGILRKDAFNRSN